MTDITLPGTWRCAFDHFAGYGAAAIAMAAGHEEVHLRWSDALDSRFELSGITWQELAQQVHTHALAHSRNSWLQVDMRAGGQEKALFSPRIPILTEGEVATWYDKREIEIDALSPQWAALDCALIGALGMPSYWSYNLAGKLVQDYGASRWEMKTRNRGEEFVGNRLRKLAVSVSTRDIDAVEAGLRGEICVDEVGDNKPDSRTSTGLMPPRPVDNARAWCALWGLSVLSTTPKSSGVSDSTAHTGGSGSGVFFLPVMTRRWSLARLRTVLRSRQLLVAASIGDPARLDAGQLASASWLRARGVSLVAVFQVHRSGNVNAPERWAELGSGVELEALV